MQLLGRMLRYLLHPAITQNSFFSHPEPPACPNYVPHTGKSLEAQIPISTVLGDSPHRLRLEGAAHRSRHESREKHTTTNSGRQLTESAPHPYRQHRVINMAERWQRRLRRPGIRNHGLLCTLLNTQESANVACGAQHHDASHARPGFLFIFARRLLKSENGCDGRRIES